jgi:hypothetical protein
MNHLTCFFSLYPSFPFSFLFCDQQGRLGACADRRWAWRARWALVLGGGEPGEWGCRSTLHHGGGPNERTRFAWRVDTLGELLRRASMGTCGKLCRHKRGNGPRQAPTVVVLWFLSHFLFFSQYFPLNFVSIFSHRYFVTTFSRHGDACLLCQLCWYVCFLDSFLCVGDGWKMDELPFFVLKFKDGWFRDTDDYTLWQWKMIVAVCIIVQFHPLWHWLECEIATCSENLYSKAQQVF